MIFSLRVITAFLVGGLLIALLSVVAERSPRALRGIIIAFPSTMVVSFVFIAIEIDSHRLIDILPGVYFGLVGGIVFALSFALIAQRFATHTPTTKWPVAATLVFASGVWFAVPFCSTFAPKGLGFALLCLLMAIAVFQPLAARYANRFPVCNSPPQTGIKEVLFRAVFAGTVIGSAVIITRLLGPFWGAVVGATYPASFGSQLMIFQAKYPARFLPSLIKTLPLGVLSTTVYATVVALGYPVFGIALGTFAALVASLTTSLLLARFSSMGVPRET